MSNTVEVQARWMPVSGAAGVFQALARFVLVRPIASPGGPADDEPNQQDQAASRTPARSTPRDRAAAGTAAARRHRVGLIAVLLLSAFLNLFRLNREGNGNEYYTATVFSMLQSWHTFFFASFDPGGFVTVDKPPLGFWIQAGSAKLAMLLGFGFSGLSVLLPEALAGVASVAILYHLVRRACGPVAGLLAALMLSVMPVSVVVSRNNTIDSLLVLTLLLAVWAAFRATEQGSLRWVLLASATIGLGFEIKMLQAYLIVPAVSLLYLVAAPARRLVRIGHLALASVVLIVVSFAWPVAVDLTPADQRPFVGSTENNSAVSLALGYNGLERLLGRGASLSLVLGQSGSTGDDGGPQGDQGPAPADGSATAPGSNGPVAGSPAASTPDGARPGDGGGPGGPGGGPGGNGENGTPGPLRLLDQQLAGQASWLLPLALMGMLVGGWSAWTHRRRLHQDRWGQGLFLWGSWLGTAATFFSVAGYYHRYYLVMLGPPVAALAAIGMVGAWQGYRHSWRLGWLLPIGLIATAGLEARILTDYPEWAAWLTPIALGGALIVAVALVLVRFTRRTIADRSWLTLGARLATTLGVLALLAAPAVWSGLPAMAGQTVGGLPAAGPMSMRGGFGGPGGGPSGGPGGPPPNGGPDGGAPTFGGPPPSGGPPPFGADGPGGVRGAGPGDGGRGPGGPGGSANQAERIAYLRANQGSATYLVATGSANQAAPIILATGQPVMALGGFLGSDPILTVDELAAKVKAGEVRFFLLDGRGGPGGPGGSGNSSLTSWVQVTCAAVPAAAIGPDATSSGLYDCAVGGPE